MNRKDTSQEQQMLHVRLLDRLEMIYGDRSVADALHKSKKSRSLIVYLILAKGKPVPYEELCGILWHKEKEQGQNNALKVLVCRTRAMLSSIDKSLHNCILAAPGAYSWNMNLTADIDIYTIETLCEEILAASRCTPEQDRKLEQLLGLYSTKLLPELSQSDWVLRYAQRLQDKYTQTVTHALELLKAAGEWDRVIKISRMSLEVLPQESRWHEEMMRAFMMMDRRSDAMTQYEQATNEERKRVWGEPSQEITDLYRQAVEADDAIDRDIDNVAQELLTPELDRGALLCDYVVFKQVYHLQQRTLERLKQQTFLAMLRVGYPKDQPLYELALEEAMQKLGFRLKESLRRGDTIARYTQSQYVVLLQGSAHESVKGVLNRIRLGFYGEMGTMAISLDCYYRPLHAEDGKTKMKAL